MLAGVVFSGCLSVHRLLSCVLAPSIRTHSPTQKVAEDIDDRDWRARDEAAPDGSARPDQWERPAPAAAAPPAEKERTPLQMAPPSNPPPAAAPAAPAAAPRPDQV